MNYSELSAGEAIRAFAGQNITVQVARRAKGVGRSEILKRPGDGFITSMEPLATEHLMSARRWEDGRVTIATIDGRKYEAKEHLPAEQSSEPGG